MCEWCVRRNCSGTDALVPSREFEEFAKEHGHTDPREAYEHFAAMKKENSE